jgi:hypothetical protein
MDPSEEAVDMRSRTIGVVAALVLGLLAVARGVRA